ncbi:MAG: pyruvate kinase alpha/beta domain-containing protein [Anaerolineae bacterium]
MVERSALCTYFEVPGPANTERTLALVQQYLVNLDCPHILVASTSGRSGARVSQLLDVSKLVVVTHSYGFAGANKQELQPEYRSQLEAAGVKILTTGHAFGGVGRAIRRKLGTFQTEEVIAFTLRTFSEGIKVACEMTLMAADAGLVDSGDEVLAIAGSGSGLDSAAVIRAANSQDYLDLRVLEIICKPRLNTGT